MQPVIVYSSLVPASAEMGQYMKELGVEAIDTKVENILEIDKAEIFKDERAKQGVLVLSPHKSEAGIPSLTVHTPGNWGKALFGGEAKKLNIAMPTLMTSILLEMRKRALLDFQVCFEVDHHGPTVDVPICFVEIGSSEREWAMRELAELVVESVLSALDSPISPDKIACGFGGGHYAPTFSKLAEQGFAFGHMMAKYNAPDLSRELLEQAVEKNTEEVEVFVVERKGLPSSAKELVRKFAEEHGLEVELV